MSRETQKQLRLVREKAGLCINCGEPSISTRCTKCRIKAVEQQRTRRSQRIAQGVCVRGCGRPALKSRTLCQEHNTESCEVNRKSLERLKVKTFDAYGGVRCACCDETELWVLCLDHINSDGGEERARLKNTGGYKFYRHLKSLGYPDKDRYRVLCANCNFLTYAERNK